ncbi:MAG: NADH:flavin oxidoreductase, partial [Pseudoxanthomonas sp.]
HVWSGNARMLECDAVVAITARLPDDALYQELLARENDWNEAGIRTVHCIGDALAPGLIAHAVYEGHRYARELEAGPKEEVAFRRHFHVAN